jgi:hypothetical protein
MTGGRRVVGARVFAIAGVARAILGVVGTIVVRVVAPVSTAGAFGFGGGHRGEHGVPVTRSRTAATP